MENLIKPSKNKIFIHLILTFAAVVLIIFTNVKNAYIFNSLPFHIKFLEFIGAWLIYFVLYYPLTSGALYIYNSVKISKYNIKKIIIAVLMIIIFNPFTYTLGESYYRKYKLWQFRNMLDKKSVENMSKKPCGPMVNFKYDYSKIDKSAVDGSDVILKIDGEETKTIDEVLAILNKKKPGDKVLLETDRGQNYVELASDPEDPNHAVLGLNLATNPYCETAINKK